MKQFSLFEEEHILEKLSELGDSLEKSKLERLSELGDALEQLKTIDWESFRPIMEEAFLTIGKSDMEAYDSVLLLKTIVLQKLYNLSDDQMEFQINDRRTFARFLGIKTLEKAPDAQAIALFKNDLTQAGMLEQVFLRFDRMLEEQGIVPREGTIVDVFFEEAPKAIGSKNIPIIREKTVSVDEDSASVSKKSFPENKKMRKLKKAIIALSLVSIFLLGCIFVLDRVPSICALIGHKPGEWEIVKECVSLTNGSKVQKCSVCNERLKEEVIPASDVHIGQTIQFGKYEQDNSTNRQETIDWIVLDIQDGKALVVSKYALDCRPYNMSNTSVTWANSTIRIWLNSVFLTEAFSNEELAKIATTTVSTEKNQSYGTSSGNATQDQIFLLSMEEVQKYFDTEDKRLCEATDYAIAKGATTAIADSNCWWWLRNSGYTSNYAVSVNRGGVINTNGLSVNSDIAAVRPAFWIDLNA